MSSTILIIDLLGGVALLLWGLGMLKAGVTRAFGTRLRLFLASGTRNRFSAFAVGLIITLGLQSSTAMAILTGSFVSQGLIGLSMAQAVMLGANVGTSLVTRILAFDLHWLAPAAFLAGTALYRARPGNLTRGGGEILVGIGLMLVALSLVSSATGPMRESPAMQAFFNLLGDAPIIAVAAAAIMATVSASSLAVVLFVAALSASGHLDPALCMLFVAGANLGGAIPPLIAVPRGDIRARQLVAANLGVRAVGALIVVALIPILAGWIDALGPLPQLAVDFHIAFNVVLALVFLPLVKAVAWVAGKVLPVQAGSKDGPSFLDENALDTPASALAAATRETLRIGDLVEKMLETSLRAFRDNDQALVRAIGDLQTTVDELQEAVKLYLSRVKRDELDPAQSRQLRDIISYAINLEHTGDIVQKSLGEMAQKKSEQHLPLSPEGFGEIESLYLRTIENLHLAQTVFLTRDQVLARRLMEGKVAIRHEERQSAERHLSRLQEGRSESIRSSSLHLDVLRDLKRINAHIASVAQPILDQLGELRESRLR